MIAVGAAAEEQRYQYAARALVLNEAFWKIARAFGLRRIDCMPLKGIALIQEVYAHPGERYFGDIDILVKPDDVMAAGEVLEELGYSRARASVSRPGLPAGRSLAAQVYCCRSPVHYTVHLHWHLVNSTLPLFMYRVDMDDVWGRSRRYECAQAVVSVLEPEQELVYLALHAFHHAFGNPSLLEDLTRFFGHYRGRIDLDAAAAVARKWNACVPLYFACRLVDTDEARALTAVMGDPGIPVAVRSWFYSLAASGRTAHHATLPVYLFMCRTLREKARFIAFTARKIISCKGIASVLS